MMVLDEELWFLAVKDRDDKLGRTKMASMWKVNKDQQQRIVAVGMG